MTNLPILDVLAVCAVGSLLCLDRVVGQWMFSRPVVAAPVIGLLLGDLHTGLTAGAVIELFWIDRLPLGIYLPPNETLVAVLVASASILAAGLSGHPASGGLVSLAVLLFLPLGILAQRLDYWHAARCERLAREALQAAGQADISAVARCHWSAVAGHLLMAAGWILMVLPPGIAILYLAYPRMPAFAVRGLTLLYGILPLLGVAAALNQYPQRGALPLFCVLFLSATVLIGFLRGG
jgi:PTS system mannose-specific IIC component